MKKMFGLMPVFAFAISMFCSSNASAGHWFVTLDTGVRVPVLYDPAVIVVAPPADVECVPTRGYYDVACIQALPIQDPDFVRIRESCMRPSGYEAACFGRVNFWGYVTWHHRYHSELWVHVRGCGRHGRRCIPYAYESDSSHKTNLGSDAAYESLPAGGAQGAARTDQAD